MNLKFENYKRLFSHPSVKFLLNELATKGYQGFGVLSIAKDDDFTSYMLKSTIEKTAKEGLILYGSKAKFSKYVKEFRTIYKKMKDFYNKLNSSSDISRSQIKEFFDLCISFISEYKNTEFIFVDKPYLALQKADNVELKENLKEYEKVKFEFRDYMNSIFLGKESFYYKIISKLSEKFAIDIEDLQQYSINEILKLFDGIKIDNKTIKERYVNIMIDNKGKIEIYYGDKAEKIINDFLKDSKKEQKISGTIVNKGKVIGAVRIIRPGWNEDFKRIKEAMEKMNKGDILVAETTSPDIMIAIRKAGAIVTDQGGLMSHAAIMSREMNVPGIVGTGNATKLLRDGDLVEVDANLGIVKIMKKANN